MYPRILVSYFSRGGNTRGVGQRIAESLAADVEEITEPRGRGGLLGYQRSCVEALFAREPPIMEARYDPSAYDVVVVGTPIWAQSLASPVRSYLRHYAEHMTRVAFFLTCGGHGKTRVFAQMAKLSRSPVAKLALTETQLRHGDDAIEVATFANQITHVLAVAGWHLPEHTRQTA